MSHEIRTHRGQPHRPILSTSVEPVRSDLAEAADRILGKRMKEAPLGSVVSPATQRMVSRLAGGLMNPNQNLGVAQGVPRDERTGFPEIHQALPGGATGPRGTVVDGVKAGFQKARAERRELLDKFSSSPELSDLAKSMRTNDLPALLSLHQKGLLAKKDIKGQTVTETLLGLTQGPLLRDTAGQEIDRKALLGQLVTDLDDPKVIWQGRGNTCGATSSSIHLAQTRPAEYARITAELAKPPGEALLPDGKSKIEALQSQINDDRSRSLTGQLLQPAFMEFANGDKYDYQVDKDSEAHQLNANALLHKTRLPSIGTGPIYGKFDAAEKTRHVAATLGRQIPGLTQPEMARLTTALFGQEYEVLGSGLSVGDVRRSLTQRAKPKNKAALEALDQQRLPAFVLMDADHGMTTEKTMAGALLKRAFPGILDKAALEGHLGKEAQDAIKAKRQIVMPADGFHWILVREIKDGRVYFDDPNRPSKAQLDPNDKARRDSDDPAYKYRYRPDGFQVDEQTGLASMPVDKFKETVWSVVVPKRQPN